MLHVCQRMIAALLSFFGVGTFVLQTDFPASYNLLRLPKSSLPYPISYITRTLPDGTRVTSFFVEAAQIFGSGDAPNEWELLAIVFEHLIRLESVLLRFTIHFVE